MSKCHIGEDASLRVKRLNSSFIPERVLSFWNLPVSVKNSANVDMFKSNCFKGFIRQDRRSILHL